MFFVIVLLFHKRGVAQVAVNRQNSAFVYVKNNVAQILYPFVLSDAGKCRLCAKNSIDSSWKLDIAILNMQKKRIDTSEQDALVEASLGDDEGDE